MCNYEQGNKLESMFAWEWASLACRCMQWQCACHEGSLVQQEPLVGSLRSARRTAGTGKKQAKHVWSLPLARPTHLQEALKSQKLHFQVSLKATGLGATLPDHRSR